MVKNPSSSAGDTRSIPSQRTKVPPAVGQLSESQLLSSLALELASKIN